MTQNALFLHPTSVKHSLDNAGSAHEQNCFPRFIRLIGFRRFRGRETMERMRARTISDPQQELIERYCAEARELIGNATSREQAIAIRTRLCTQLAQECNSSLILDATQTYVDRVIQNLWDKPEKGTDG